MKKTVGSITLITLIMGSLILPLILNIANCTKEFSAGEDSVDVRTRISFYKDLSGEALPPEALPVHKYLYVVVDIDIKNPYDEDLFAYMQIEMKDYIGIDIGFKEGEVVLEKTTTQTTSGLTTTFSNRLTFPAGESNQQFILVIRGFDIREGELVLTYSGVEKGLQPLAFFRNFSFVSEEQLQSGLPQFLRQKEVRISL